MAVFYPGIFPKKGWRRTGIFNLVLAFSCGLLLFILLCISLSRQESNSFLGTTQVHRGLCKDTSKLNVVLHLALNMVSTGILASSNFFMQIVTSPSRLEIDQAHTYLRSLDIGFQSLRNISSLSWFKRTIWFLLILSSVPLHLFFNSAIYQTKYLSQTFHITIATNHFIDGGKYWLPGASLSPSGSSSPVQKKPYSSSPYSNPDHPHTPNGNPRDLKITGFGDPIDLSEYPASLENGKPPKDGGAWEHLDAERCMEEYRTSESRSDFTNVIIVVDSGLSELNGWRRVDVYGFDSDHAPQSSNLSTIWDAMVPPNEVNSLWSWNRCSVGEMPYRTNSRYNTCGRLLGLGSEIPDWDTIPKDVKDISFRDDGMNGTTQSAEADEGYMPQLRTLRIDHCMAERANGCQIRISNALLLVVITCVITKVAICTILFWYLKTKSLVTPGDVIESFISTPDPVTRGLATLSMNDVQVLEFSRRKHYETIEDAISFQPPARRWQGGSLMLKSAISRGIWIQVYYPTFLALSALLVGVVFSFFQRKLAKFGQVPSNDDVLEIFEKEPGYLGTLLITNTPQLISSFCYLAVNLLHTQLQVEEEWNSYARSYKPLRVSYPVGDQFSTNRLQLPYRYIVPMMITSTVMHWLISSSIYLVIIEGDSGFPHQLPGLNRYLGVSSGAAIAIGYSNLFILITFIVGCFFALLPLFFRHRKLRGDMVQGGTNSLVLSAACHVPIPFWHSAQAMETPGSGDQDAKAYLKELSRRKVRWGAMALPPDTTPQVGESGAIESRETIMHLGFAGPDHAVDSPQKGQLYL